MIKNSLIVLALTASAWLPAQAALATDAAQIANPMLFDFDSYDGFITDGPEALGGGVTFHGDEGSELGAFIRDLGDNGAWGAGRLFAAGGFDSAVMFPELRFQFDSARRGAGAYVNHFASIGMPFAVAVTAFGMAGEVLESYTVPVSTGFDSYNEGPFIGITRSQADIQALSFRGTGVVLDDLRVSAVPEPGTTALLLAGLGAVGLLMRRRRAQV
jgi:hypothetical protein